MAMMIAARMTFSRVIAAIWSSSARSGSR